MKGPLFLLLFFILLLPEAGRGQVFNKPADLAEAFKSGEAKVLVGFDSRRSFISRRDVKVFGVRAGLDLQGKARLGFGMYFLRSPFFRTFHWENPAGTRDTLISQLNFNYMTVFFEPVVLSTKRWEVSVPLHIGIGEAFYRGPKEFAPSTPKTILLAEGSVIGHYKILPWIGIGGGVGFRQMLRANTYLREDFNAPIYMLNLKLFTGYILRKIFPNI